MARTVKDTRLDTRAARERLDPRKKPYFRVIDTGRHIGYYKGPRAGTWLARTNAGGRYVEKKLGTADDTRDANGFDVLSFSQAQAAARNWFDGLAHDQEVKASGPVHTLRSAIEQYIAARDERESARQGGRSVNSSAAHKLRLHVLGDAKLADLELSTLTASALAEWRKALPGTTATRQRVTNDFKAALNRVAPTASVRLAIKDGLASPKDEAPDPVEDDAAAVESKLLSDAETRQFLKAVREAGDDDLYRMCLVLASTGARFAQARRLKVRDVQVARARIMMPASHKGRVGNKARPPVPVPVGPDVIDALLPAIKGRKGDELLLERWRHVQIGPAEWKRDRRGGWQSASEMARPIRAAAAAAGLPASASSYSFRHSSIVRALREGLPVRLVAQIHDTSIQMIERNYTRFMAHALEEMARKAIMPMVEPDRGDNVVNINGRGGAA
jgi:integrase